MDEGDKTDLKGTQEPSSNNSAKEGSNDEGGLGDTYFSHSKQYHCQEIGLVAFMFSLNFYFLMFFAISFYVFLY